MTHSFTEHHPTFPLGELAIAEWVIIMEKQASKPLATRNPSSPSPASWTFH